MKKSTVSFFIGLFLTSTLFVSCSGNSENSLENIQGAFLTKCIQRFIEMRGDWMEIIHLKS